MKDMKDMNVMNMSTSEGGVASRSHHRTMRQPASRLVRSPGVQESRSPGLREYSREGGNSLADMILARSHLRWFTYDNDRKVVIPMSVDV